MGHRKLIGKEAVKIGKAPAVILMNPKFPRNVGAVVRACSCFGVEQVWYTGNRFKLDNGERLPREERMKGYGEVDTIQFDFPFEQFGRDVVPVAIELQPNSESLPKFEHPENAVYVFGPEDGSIPQTARKFCHRFVSIPTRHCTNLSAAVYIVLYDRLCKLNPEAMLVDTLAEERGYMDDPIFEMHEG